MSHFNCPQWFAELYDDLMEDHLTVPEVLRDYGAKTFVRAVAEGWVVLVPGNRSRCFVTINQSKINTSREEPRAGRLSFQPRTTFPEPGS